MALPEGGVAGCGRHGGAPAPPGRDAGAAGAIFPGCGRGHRSVSDPRRGEEDEVGDQTGRDLQVPTGKSSRRRLAPETEGGGPEAGRGCSWGRAEREEWGRGRNLRVPLA